MWFTCRVTPIFVLPPLCPKGARFGLLTLRMVFLVQRVFRVQANERNRKPLDQMHRVPAGVTASDLNALLYPAMGAMTMYRTELDSSSMVSVAFSGVLHRA